MTGRPTVLLQLSRYPWMTRSTEEQKLFDLSAVMRCNPGRCIYLFIFVMYHILHILIIIFILFVRRISIFLKGYLVLVSVITRCID